MLSNAIIKINEFEFTLQHPGIGFVLSLNENCTIKNEHGVVVTSAVEVTKRFLEHVVVQPKLTIADFDEDGRFKEQGYKVLEALTEEVNRFLERKPLRYRTNKGTDNK